MADPDRVIATVRSFLRLHKKDEEAALDTPLFADGLGLDSLQTAELSAVLEDVLGTDPFSEGEMPQTLAEIVAFYEAGAAAQA
jgi:acyl carrier protein